MASLRRHTRALQWRLPAPESAAGMRDAEVLRYYEEVSNERTAAATTAGRRRKESSTSGNQEQRQQLLYYVFKTIIAKSTTAHNIWQQSLYGS